MIYTEVYYRKDSYGGQDLVRKVYYHDGPEGRRPLVIPEKGTTVMLGDSSAWTVTDVIFSVTIDVWVIVLEKIK